MFTINVSHFYLSNPELLALNWKSFTKLIKPFLLYYLPERPASFCYLTFHVSEKSNCSTCEEFSVRIYKASISSTVKFLLLTYMQKTSNKSLMVKYLQYLFVLKPLIIMVIYFFFFFLICFLSSSNLLSY